MFIQKCLRSKVDFSKRLVPASKLIFRSLTSVCDNKTIREVENRWRQRFEEAGVPEPVESIRHILAHVIGTTKTMEVINNYEKKLDSQQIEKLDSLCECRLLRMPVQYIIGNWDFRDVTLKLVPPIFIPRPETEILVDIVLKHILSLDASSCKVLEVGCGSGAISLALAHSNGKINCTAIDANVHACKLALENAQNLKLTEFLTIAHATLLEDGKIVKYLTLLGNDDQDFHAENQFDCIVSNPPYVPTKQVFKLDPEIKLFEDIRALDGGEDGLKVIKPLLKYAAVALKPGGRIFIEVDPTHPEDIQYFTKKFAELKLQYSHTYKDFCNNNRFVEVLKLC